VTFDQIIDTTRRCAAWLRDDGIGFVLAGSVAAWARGGPAVCSDLDFVVRPDDAQRALDLLAANGLRPERPPEGWLLKAHDGEVLVDLISELNGVALEDCFAAATTLSVMSVDMTVMSVDDILTTKLLSFEEHYIDFAGLLPIARALREQADWEAVRARTRHSAIAAGFFTMAERLGIAPGAVAARDVSRIRVSSA
jgi:hypothetical protein